MVERKLNRLSGFNYSNDGYYFVTVCTKDMKQWFGNVVDREMIINTHGLIVHEELMKTEQIRKNVHIDEFIIMPNHIHAIIVVHNTVGVTRRVAPTNRLMSNSLGSIIGQFKSVVTKRIRLEGLVEFEWQRSFYDHIIRNETSLNSIRNYIKYNPYKWGIDEYNPERYFNY